MNTAKPVTDVLIVQNANLGGLEAIVHFNVSHAKNVTRKMVNVVYVRKVSMERIVQNHAH